MAERKKESLQKELNAILQALQESPSGAGLDIIRQRSGLTLEPKTLQRRLVLLIQQGQVRAEGKTNGTAYYLAGHITKIPSAKNEVQPADTPPLSPRSQHLLRTIRQASELRTPVGYKRSFLDDYLPNQTNYLTLEQRNDLAEIGKTISSQEAAGTYARQILNRLLIDLSWNSSRLEGNTYSLLDTQRLLAEGRAAPEKSTWETQMILNHKEAIEFLVQDADDAIGFNRYTIQSLHALLSNNLLGDPGASGRLRSFGVGITGSVYTPLATPQQIEELFDLFLQKAGEIQNPFEQAFFCMVHLPYLQPFDDVNKRVSRLAANIPFNRHNLSPLSFTDVPQDLYVSGLLGIYELNDVSLLQDVFLWAYERSAAKYAALRQTLGEPDPFRLRYREKLREIIKHIMAETFTKSAATVSLNSFAKELPAVDRQRFIVAVETELLSLHEGNFARYGVSPAQYKAWKAVWDTPER